MNYKVDYISVGKIANITFSDQKSKKTAIFKEPFKDKMYLTHTGFVEDKQQYKGHGGPEKALCFYSKDNYAYWDDIIDLLPKYAIFGENITVSGLTEEDLNIGDTYELGEAIIQVSCPRQPCATIAQRYGIKDLVKRMADSYRTGCYFRVLKEGYVSQNDNMRLIEQTEPKLSIYELNETRFNDSKNLQRIDNILNHEAINDETREIFTKLRKRLS
ncbi:MOSC domain-containing protein [Mammaliicoccus sciuri]|uniref:MOSC domain-containing protein n=1 Tax=Mammaliicoccus sciuri TaxID=1296 RepID=UPI0015D0B39B|nr:MOSC domain-containing protein [Mammaliicoccus sciuri]MBF0719063.1 MOSC domain-containing protein [Mammaliicoccus sciuri]MCD8771802.1 MOSC domain-containing protein [Mammaliicoccus sciuri]MCD8885488.1 MOSC domain-containing protein [Mammaliicoccus sciuri]MCJ0955347.1 MOSC domain-containing protein [Mammaliicoccus sciuri]MDU0267309.1 MOSC domain-containing protein [Mammaliicoccus sciuri]